MPELPDIELYRCCLNARVSGRVLRRVRVASPFLVRSVAPPLDAAEGREVIGVDRLGKRLVFRLSRDLFLALHLMIAGRLRWRPPGARIPGRLGLAALDFDEGSLVITEAGSKRRAALHLVEGEEALRELDRGGLEVIGSDRSAFAAALQRENHTLERALTDPRLLSGIGNAYSDEILHDARLSPLKLTRSLTDDDLDRLHESAQRVLRAWTDRLITETGDGWPEKVTAFRPGMSAHGRYGQPCPRCGSPIQRIVHGEHEANYCATCQTGGRLLADRALSRLLREDWPRTLDEFEARKAARRRAHPR
jgi:formamidopyrimidine-DNA glycosylase